MSAGKGHERNHRARALAGTSDLDVKLSAAVLRELQASGIRRVLVTVTVKTATEPPYLGARTQGGKNRWYVISGKTANGVLKVRDGVIKGIGMAVKQLTNTQAEQKVLFDQAALNASR